MILPDISRLLIEQPVIAYPVVFAGGVLTSLTPCIYPMIPITAAVVGGQRTNSQPDSNRGSSAWALTAAYVLGLSLAYASLGLFAGMSGQIFGAISTNKWLLLGMANVMLLFGLMMLDVIPVPVPTSWLTRAATMQSGGRLVGALGMGAASGLVAAPCGAPVMAALLTWVAATHSAWRGFTYLFVFSLGMCTLLVMIGLAAGSVSRMPRAGLWMVRVKSGFAIVMLGMAEYYLLQSGQVWF